MELQWCFLVAHGLLTLLVAVSFLCGHWPIFEGTFIERIHSFLTFGAYEYFLRFVGAICGSRGRNFFLGIEHYCCNRPNPILQGLYIALVGGTYFIIVSSSFQYIPGHYVGELHRYLSMVAVGVGVLLFLLTSFSDPGTVTSVNVSEYLSSYPYDNIIYVEKECSTCRIMRPARSKHCRICDRCVARFDHHCGWMNNCTGEKNTRYFVAFLFWHFMLCLYGAIIIGLILAGQLEEKKVIYILTVFYGIEKSFSGLFPHVVQWLVVSHNVQILLAVFLSIISFLLAGFFGYHAHLCLTNKTTNETYKWQDYISWKRKLQETRATAAAIRAGNHSTKDEVEKQPESRWKRLLFCRRLQQTDEVVTTNTYDRGYLANLYEIVVPFSERSFSHKKSA